jgi:predicted AlkP superfamily phosphohydrolase/phosphomutase
MPSAAADSRKKRVLVIGLDGASFKILNPYVSRGVMPTLSRLMVEGVHAPLLSVIPTLSASAWSSFMTGKNSGKHGVFAFEDLVISTADHREIVNAQSVRAKTLWNILSEHGRRVGVFNVPLTYPPDEVDGFIVSGMLTPQSKGVCTYPEDLGKTIKAKFPNYKVDIPWKTYRGREEKLLRDLLELTLERRNVALFLMNDQDLDFFQVVFVGPDRMQHPMMKYIDPYTPDIVNDGIANKYRTFIEDYFLQLDHCVGEILACAGENTLVLVISDHGFMTAKVQFTMNEWLAQVGALRWRSNAGLSLVDRFVQLAPASVVQLLVRFAKVLHPMYAKVTANRIDWGRTRAFSTFSYEHSAITINLIGRQPNGTVPLDEYDNVRAWLRKELEQAKDPKSGLPVAQRVFFKEELYQGPYLDQAPDIVMEPALHIATGAYGGRLFESTRGVSGVHQLDGVFIAAGPGLLSGKYLDEKPISILDVAPTILSYMGIPIPEDMDGRVVVEMFSPQFIANNAIVKTSVDQERPNASAVEEAYDEDELREIEKRLEDLGYL